MPSLLSCTARRLSVWIGIVLLLPLLLSLLLPMPARAVPPGSSYVADAGWGHLRFKGNRFSLETLGVNGHSCTLDGVRKGPIGDAGEGCKVQFKALPDGSLAVAAASPDVEDACRMFCGMRAHFENTYHPTPAGCEDDERRAARAEGLKAYKAGRHAEASGHWDALARRCGASLHWSESYALNNDRAVAAFHQGRLAECVALSREVADEQRLQMFRETAPSDHDILLPLYRAARFNLQRCGGEAAKR